MGVAQLVEHRIVTPVVVGSIPIVHPIILRKCQAAGLAFLFQRYADVVKLVDTPDLGSGAARCGSSSLPVRTIQKSMLEKSVQASAVNRKKPLPNSRPLAAKRGFLRFWCLAPPQS